MLDFLTAEESVALASLAQSGSIPLLEQHLPSEVDPVERGIIGLHFRREKSPRAAMAIGKRKYDRLTLNFIQSALYARVLIKPAR